MSIDIDSLLSAPVDGPMSTERPVCPEGEYTAIVDELGEKGARGWLRSGTIGKGDRAGETFITAGIPFVILDQKVKDLLRSNKVTVPGDQFLDLDRGKISTKAGANVLIGQTRAALGLNSVSFASTEEMLSQMAGKGPVKVFVKHQITDNGSTFAKVTRVAKA